MTYNTTLTQTYRVSPDGGGSNTLGTAFNIASNLPAVGSIVKSLSSIGSAIGIAQKSPRYGGGDGPLFTTVNAFIRRIESGETAVIEQLNQLRKTDADKVQWQLFWSTDMLRVQMTPEQRALVVRLDPTQAGKFVTMNPQQVNNPLANFMDPAALGQQAAAAGGATPGNYMVLGFLILGALLLARR